MVIVRHCELVYPHYCAKALNARRLLIVDKIPYEKALADGLSESIVAFCRARGCSTRRTECTCTYAGYIVATGTLELFEVDCGSVALIELVVEIVPRALHFVENVKAPVDRVEVICVLVGANVAHARLTTATEL